LDATSLAANLPRDPHPVAVPADRRTVAGCVAWLCGAVSLPSPTIGCQL